MTQRFASAHVFMIVVIAVMTGACTTYLATSSLCESHTLEQVWFPDHDGDGFGRAEGAVLSCSSPPDGYSINGGDCDDDDPNRTPGKTERCDGFDNDCNGLVDDGEGIIVYQDLDGDGFGNDNVQSQGCSTREGWSEFGGDCDDLIPTVHPGAQENPFGGDANCDGVSALASTSRFFIQHRPDTNCEDGQRLDALYQDDATDLFQNPFPVVTTCDVSGLDRFLTHVAIMDYNGDTLDDLWIGTAGGNIAVIERLPGLGWGTPNVIAAIPGVMWRSSGDLDNDGSIDLLGFALPWGALGALEGVTVLNAQSANPVIVRNAFVVQRNWMSRLDDGFLWEMPRVVEDMTGDGCADIIGTAYNGGNQPVHLLLGNCDGTFGVAATAVTSPAAQRGLDAFDVDGDGDFDIWTSSDDDGDPGQTWWFPSDGAGVFGAPADFVDFLPANESGNNGLEGPGMCAQTIVDGDSFVDLVCTWGGYLGAPVHGGIRAGDGSGLYQSSSSPMLDPGASFPAGVVGPHPNW